LLKYLYTISSAQACISLAFPPRFSRGHRAKVSQPDDPAVIAAPD
jgi:hypothetical protein